MKIKEKELIERLKGSLQLNLVHYGTEIEDIELHIKGTLENGYDVSSAIETRTQISILLNYLKDKPTDTKTFNMKEYKELLKFLDKKFEKIKQRKDFHEKALKDLKSLVNTWEHHVQWPAIESNSFDNDLEFRDDCEALLRELQEKKEITELKKRIKNADVTFQGHSLELLKRFQGVYEHGEWNYYPKSYWWRHLKEFVEKQEEKK